MTRRRELLRTGATAGVVVAGAVVAPGALGATKGRDYDVPKSLLVDKVVRTTCSPNCTGSCGQLAFVRDGVLVKIQQAADYPDKAYAPRGCMKGLSYLNQVYGPDRITRPLIRTGARGSGEFREASWDEVLDKVASDLARIGATWGWDSIHIFGQVPGSGYIQKGANYRAAALLGMTHGTSFDFNGDLPMGMPITFGVQNAEHEAKDWANSRFLLLVGSNPVETRIPDVHFIFDAVDAGAKLVVVDPVYSPTASKADAWLQIAPGTDAALALALCRQIVADGAVDVDFMRTYTDAPLLVRTDSGKRLREKDLVAGGSESVFVAWDERAGAPVLAGTARLGFTDGVRPALLGTFQVPLADGTSVGATPGYALVAKELDQWTPERAAAVTAIPAERIVSLARSFARTKPAAILMGGGSNHWYHGDLTGRAFGLLSALTGNVGRSGGGFSVYVGQYKVRVDTSPWWNPGGQKAKVVPSIYFVRGKTATMSADVPYPKNGWHGLICTFANMFVQAMDVNQLHRTLAGLDLIVVVDHQRTETVQWADVVLPATTWYEKTDLTATPLHPYLQLQQAAIEPVGEARSEVWMWRELMRRIAPDLAAKYFEMTEDDAIRAILQAGGGPGGPTEGITLEQLREGPVRLRVPDPDVAFASQIRDRAPFPPRSLPAALEATAAFIPTRRIEFYKEDDTFIRLRETVPTYREPFDDGVHDPKTYPLTLLTPHSKWRIHSSYANNEWLAEIHGGRPEVFVHPTDAERRGIATGDVIEVFNTRGSVQAWAHVSDAQRPGAVTLPEGWWPRQFAKGKGVNELTSSAVNPIHEVRFVGNMWSPSTGWKDCRCEIRKAGEAPRA
ncbi:MAG TPA: molybdopterin-dependent oxidoreductase [Candidatus Limnocylindria bacterium]|nr:molybdopterin-dependent oxidoreductase [Candidatus Limnocylindria bacterium]